MKILFAKKKILTNKVKIKLTIISTVKLFISFAAPVLLSSSQNLQYQTNVNGKITFNTLYGSPCLTNMYDILKTYAQHIFNALLTEI